MLFRGHTSQVILVYHRPSSETPYQPLSEDLADANEEDILGVCIYLAEDVKK